MELDLKSGWRVMFTKPLSCWHNCCSAIWGILFGLALLCVAQDLTGQVVFDNASQASVNSSTLTWSHTVGSNSNRLLMVGVSIRGAGSTVSSVTYGGVPLTNLTSVSNHDNAVRAEMWYLKSPAIGAANIIVTLSSSKKMVCGGASFYDVDLTNTFGTVATRATIGSGNADPLVNVSSAFGDLVFDVLSIEGDALPLAAGAGQTRRWELGTGPWAGDAGGASSTEPGAASVTMSWSKTPAAKWAIAAVPIQSASGEICNNGLDDDGDGFVDSYDGDCNSPPSCVAYNTEFVGAFVPNLRCSYASNISAYASPMVADVDNDGQVEVITYSQDAGQGLIIVNGSTCALEAFIDFPGTVDFKHGNVTLGDVDADGYIDIFATADDSGDLFRIEFDGVSYVTVWTAPGAVISDRKHLEIIDLNRDGVAEIIPNQGSMINALTGVAYPGTVPAVHTHNKGIAAYSADADLGNNGNEGDVEMILGTEIYRYDFVLGNWNLIRALAAPYNTTQWIDNGNTALADMDLDGDVDAVVCSFDNGNVLVWDLQTATLLAGGGTFAGGVYSGRATIGNFDSDPYPEFAFSAANIIRGMEDIVNSNLGAGGYEVLWSDITTDASGHTGMTLFDFEGDGLKELVYRDTDRLRVFRGRGDGAGGPLVLFDSGPSTCASSTGSEFPVIADVTQDGQANIVVACNGFISVYQTGNQPWVEARSIWNTQSYCFTNVNDDGTIPAQFQENYTVFNDYMAQRSNYVGGNPIAVAAPDATFEIQIASGDSGFIRLECADSIGVIIGICNNGSAPIETNIPYAFYENDPYVAMPPAILVREDSFILVTPLIVGACFIDTLWFEDDDGAFYSFVGNHDPGAGPLPIPADTVYTSFLECDYGGNAISLIDMTVEDDTPPTMVCQDLTIYVDGSGNASIVAGDVDNGTTDACGISSLSLDIRDFDCSDLGANSVTLTGTDVNGNSASCMATITVLDTIKPLLSCPNDITVNVDPNACDALVSYQVPVGTDNCPSPTTIMTAGFASGSAFPQGTTTVTYQVTDGSGNIRTCSFDVTVNPDGDNDGDGVCDNQDLDDDNDGIPDLDEAGCTQNPDFKFAQWKMTTIPREEGQALIPATVPSVLDLIGGAGIGLTMPGSAMLFSDVDQPSLSTAKTQNDYVEFGWNTQSGINALRLTQFGYRKNGVAAQQDFYITVEITDDNFISSTTILDDHYIDATGIGSLYTVAFDYQSYLMLPSTTYRIRVYFYGKSSGTMASLDDIGLFMEICDQSLDTDGDGVPNILDLDSDNDGIYDVVEAGSDQPFTNGILDGAVTANGIPVSVDTDANDVIDYILADSDGDGSIDAVELDSDNDGCFDVIEAGYTDADSDGALGPAPLTVNAGNGLVTSGGP